MPPHTPVRITDEYGLIIATWQPDSPVCVTPGMNEQCRLWTCRSRCCTKSYVETAANTTPTIAPASTTRGHGWGLLMRVLYTPAERGVQFIIVPDVPELSRAEPS